jgi:orotate phosphoribosyltransferase
MVSVHSLSPSSLVENYLRIIVDRDEQDEIIFSQWLVLKDMELARSLAEAAASKVRDLSPSEGSCILADSGISLGVLIAQALGQPMYFYRREPWSIDDEPVAHSIYPRVPPGLTVSLVDSHTMTGFTSSTCHDMLQENNVSVDRVITILNLSDLSEDTRSQRAVDHISLSDGVPLKKVWIDLFGHESWIDIGGAIRKARRSAKKQIFLTDSIDETGYLPSKSRRLSAIGRSLFRIRGDLRFDYVSKELAQELRGLFGSTESEVWRVFTYPDVIKRVSIATGEAIDLSRFGVIVATGYLGMFFALCLAWYNDFNGSILSTRTPVGWQGVRTNAGEKRCLICSGRILTSNYVLGAIRLSSAYALEPDMILTLRLSGEGVSFPRDRALLGLDKLGIPIVALS